MDRPGNDLTARFGRDVTHAEWFHGFRLAIKATPGSRVIRAWSIVAAAVNEREVAEGLLQARAAAQAARRRVGPYPEALG